MPGAMDVARDRPRGWVSSDCAAAPAFREKRRAKRVVATSHRAGIARLDADGLAAPATEAEILDFSVIGIGLICGEEMTPGEQFVLRLVGRHGKNARLIYCVVRCVRISHGQFIVGAEFVGAESAGDHAPAELLRRENG